MTALFIDTEFNGFRGDLISMALVSENGREWYESVGCDDPVPWVAEHVMPYLQNKPCDYVLMQRSLQSFLGGFESVHIVADWPEDIQHFCQVLITGPGTRLDTPPLTFEVRRDLDDAVSDLPHNALEDARGIMRFVTAQQPAEQERTESTAQWLAKHGNDFIGQKTPGIPEQERTCRWEPSQWEPGRHGRFDTECGMDDVERQLGHDPEYCPCGGKIVEGDERDDDLLDMPKHLRRGDD